MTVRPSITPRRVSAGARLCGNRQVVQAPAGLHGPVLAGSRVARQQHAVLRNGRGDPHARGDPAVLPVVGEVGGD
ncbi:hypothetical protein [Streptomyces sp. NPDC000618]|uniref:hypothetical protein n=1 Tax=Streptomyces sp. NPDC000618 TaxID=3154265 RepID=UPI003333D4A9